MLMMLLLVNQLISQISHVSAVSLKDAGNSAVSQNGKYFYVTNFDGMSVFDINQKTGGLTKKQTIKGNDGLEISGIAISPDDKFLYTKTYKRNPDFITSEVRIFSCNAKTGELTLISTFDNQDGDRFEYNSNRFLSPQGNLFFVTNNSNQDLFVYRRNTSTGALKFLQKYHSETLGMYSDLRISPDEKFLYAYSMNIYKACIVFSLDVQSGSMNQIQEIENPNYRHYNSQDLILSPDGRHAYTVGTDSYAANQTQPKITVYSRDSRTGKLTYQKNYDNLLANGVVDLSFLFMDGSGDYLYALTSYGDELHGIHVYKRNIETGEITYKQSFVDKAPTDKMKGAYFVSFGKGNKYIYVSVARDHAVNIFSNPNGKESVAIPVSSGTMVEDDENENFDPSDSPDDVYSNSDLESEEAPEDIEGAEGNDEMTTIHRKLQAESSDTRRLDLSYALLEGKSLKIIQIASMAMTFKSEYKRLEFVKFTSYFASDPENLNMLEDLFTYESIRKDFRKHVANLKD